MLRNFVCSKLMNILFHLIMTIFNFFLIFDTFFNVWCFICKVMLKLYLNWQYLTIILCFRKIHLKGNAKNILGFEHFIAIT